MGCSSSTEATAVDRSHGGKTMTREGEEREEDARGTLGREEEGGADCCSRSTTTAINPLLVEESVARTVKPPPLDSLSSVGTAHTYSAQENIDEAVVVNNTTAVVDCRHDDGIRAKAQDGQSCLLPSSINSPKYSDWTPGRLTGVVPQVSLISVFPLAQTRSVTNDTMDFSVASEQSGMGMGMTNPNTRAAESSSNKLVTDTYAGSGSSTLLISHGRGSPKGALDVVQLGASVSSQQALQWSMGSTGGASKLGACMSSCMSLTFHRVPSVMGDRCEEPETPDWWTEFLPEEQEQFSINVRELQDHFAPPPTHLVLRVAQWDTQKVVPIQK